MICKGGDIERGDVLDAGAKVLMNSSVVGRHNPGGGEDGNEECEQSALEKVSEIHFRQINGNLTEEKGKHVRWRCGGDRGRD